MADDDDGQSDLALLERYRRGDARAMDRLVERHAGAVYAFARRMLGDGPGLDDLVQEVWLKVLRGTAAYDGRSRFTTWLFAVTRNACLDHARRRRRAPPGAEGGGDAEGPPAVEGVVDPSPPVLDRVARRELGAMLEQAVAALPLEQREVFLLREHTDMSFQEISASLGVPRDTVKSRMRYALAHVRRFLRDRLGVTLEVPPRGL
ncbi:MAG: sigma-70 family RNA polymerase sigma factor [Planctomycetes bacterium]|nr:sigma-70 family RNA polymerase sigma factor [Planctomycetota bacterium]